MVNDPDSPATVGRHIADELFPGHKEPAPNVLETLAGQEYSPYEYERLRDEVFAYGSWDELLIDLSLAPIEEGDND